DYNLNQRLTFEDVDETFEQSELMQESLTKNIHKDEDELTGTWFDTSDRHAWESLWFQDFAKRLPVVVEDESFYNFSNPAFKVSSLDESTRLGSNERDAHFNILISREQRLSKQFFALEQTLGFFPNSKYFDLESFSSTGPSL